MSHQFFVEMIQALCITLLMYVAATSVRRSSYRTCVLATLTATLSLISKTTSFMFVLPMLVYIATVSLFHRRPKELCNSRADLLAAVVVALVVSAVAIWYAINWSPVVTHFSVATTSPFYGTQTEFFPRLIGWVGRLEMALTPIRGIFIGVVAVTILGLVLGFVRIIRNSAKEAVQKAIDRGHLFAALLAGTIVATLSTYSIQVAEDTRYLMPIIPMIAALVIWSLATMGSRMVSVIVLLGLAGNAAVLHAYALGVPVLKSGPRLFLNPVHRDQDERSRLTLVIQSTCPQEVAGSYNITIGDYPSFNVNSANFFSEKEKYANGLRCRYLNLGYDPLKSTTSHGAHCVYSSGLRNCS